MNDSRIASLNSNGQPLINHDMALWPTRHLEAICALYFLNTVLLYIVLSEICAHAHCAIALSYLASPNADG